jgi:hypothetical protein
MWRVAMCVRGELLDLALGQHRRVHGDVNAIVRLMEPEARSQLLPAALAARLAACPS